MNILLWHVHGGWMDSFVRGGHSYLVPALPHGGSWGLGRGGRDWPENVVEVEPSALRGMDIDVVVLQRLEEIHAVELLTGRLPGRRLPAVFLEHNTPRGAVPASSHPLANQDDIPVVHVTHFNRLMWDTGTARVAVVEHGVPDPGPLYTGVLEEQGVVINEPVRRGRATGTDLLPAFGKVSPLTVFGIGGGELAGHLGLAPQQLCWGGDLTPGKMHERLAQCRLYLHPMRWTSLGLSLIEAMLMAMPVVVLGCTEASRTVPPEAGAISTDVDELVRAAQDLLEDPSEAVRRGKIAREAALQRHSLTRFLDDWDELLHGFP
jgi:glycosyltransferase involved in cell wall biosynthesis